MIFSLSFFLIVIVNYLPLNLFFLFAICLMPLLFLERLRRLLCGEDPESLFEDDSVLGVLVIRREASRMCRPGGLPALCADLSHGVLLAAIAIGKEHLFLL